MAITSVGLSVPSGTTLFTDTDNENTKVAVKASSGTIYSIVIDNSANGAASFTKLWNVASGSVTVGTTAPDMILNTPASVKRTHIMPEGVTFDTAITVATVTAAGTAGTTSPTSSAIVYIVYA